MRGLCTTLQSSPRRAGTRCGASCSAPSMGPRGRNAPHGHSARLRNLELRAALGRAIFGQSSPRLRSPLGRVPAICSTFAGASQYALRAPRRGACPARRDDISNGTAVAVAVGSRWGSQLSSPPAGERAGVRGNAPTAAPHRGTLRASCSAPPWLSRPERAPAVRVARLPNLAPRRFRSAELRAVLAAPSSPSARPGDRFTPGGASQYALRAPRRGACRRDRRSTTAVAVAGHGRGHGRGGLNLLPLPRRGKGWG